MKFAVIGLGRMGVRHLEMLEAAGAEIAGGADTREQSRAAAIAACRSLCVENVYSDAQDMLAALKPEGVVIATTAPSHCALTLAAVDAGVKRILCEKPLATSIADCRRMVSACERAGARLAVNHQMRFMEQYTSTRSTLESDALGGMTSMNVLAGNFGMAMNGSHYFEAFRFMAGAQPTLVSARFSALDVPNPRGSEFQDAAGVVSLEAANGRRFHMDAGADQGHGIHVVYGARNGRVVVDELTGEVSIVAREAEHREMPTTRYGMPWSEETQTIAPTSVIGPSQAVFEAMMRGDDYPDGRTGLSTVSYLVAAYLSNEDGGRPIVLGEESLPEDRVFPWA